MPTLKANHRQIMAAKPIDGRKTRYRIEGEPGLWLYVSPTGTRTWYARYQVGSGPSRTERWFRIGDARATPLAVAAKRAQEVSTAVNVDERDPHGERDAKRTKELTFGDVFDDWYRRHARPKLARHETDMTHYRNHVAGEFAKMRIADLKRIEIARYRDKVAAKASPLVSNEVLMLINRVLYWAMDEGLIDANPAARLRRAGKRKPRERVLNHAGIVAFWRALDAMETMTGAHMARAEKGRMLSPATRSILRLLLLTGQRRSEVVEARKSELELDGPEPVWTIPGERTKNGLLHRLPLCPLSRAELAKAVGASPSKSLFVFPSPEDHKLPISANAVTRAMARLITQLRIPTVSPHDLRRTVGTELARLGLPVHVRSLVLNHSPMSRGITEAVYNRYAYDKEKREALAAWEAELTRLLARMQNPAREAAE
ncbi:MAG: tyrosine-type recombinase/integrase [Hyphomicrobiaceae bacterium]